MKKVTKKTKRIMKAPKSDDTVELLHFVVANMATKDDIAQLRKEVSADMQGLRKEVHEDMQEIRDDIADIKVDIRYIKAELADVRSVLENIQGYRQEIDFALERIARIERHLGLPSARRVASKR